MGCGMLPRMVLWRVLLLQALRGGLCVTSPSPRLQQHSQEACIIIIIHTTRLSRLSPPPINPALASQVLHSPPHSGGPVRRARDGRCGGGIRRTSSHGRHRRRRCGHGYGLSTPTPTPPHRAGCRGGWSPPWSTPQASASATSACPTHRGHGGSS